MKTFNHILAAATLLGLSCGAYAGVTSAPASVSTISNGAADVTANTDATFASESRRIDHADLYMNGAAVSPVYLVSGGALQPPMKHSDAPTAVPLPSAAPAGLLTLGLIGSVAFARRLRRTSLRA